MVSETARRLRANQTEFEKRLWSRLRDRGLFGIKFRRQVPLDAFVADFASVDHGLIVEIDGGQHSAIEDADRRRTSWLESRGWRVIRFWNNDVGENIAGVLQIIAGACGIDVDDPHPNPLPKGEGEVKHPLPEGEKGRYGRPRRVLSRGCAPRRRG
jgi:very-short-patch-repair endonuclease